MTLQSFMKAGGEEIKQRVAVPGTDQRNNSGQAQEGEIMNGRGGRMIEIDSEADPPELSSGSCGRPRDQGPRGRREWSSEGNKWKHVLKVDLNLFSNSATH